MKKYQCLVCGFDIYEHQEKCSNCNTVIDMDIITKDNYVNVSTDAMQYGFSAELARRFIISKQFDIEPSLGVYYTMLDIDDFSDDYGKSIEFDVLHYWEAELGFKLNYLGKCDMKLVNKLANECK